VSFSADRGEVYAGATVVLRADDVERSLTVKVVPRPAVEGVRFGASARWVAGTENVTVRWSTRFAESA
jgi:hypothetical protein